MDGEHLRLTVIFKGKKACVKLSTGEKNINILYIKKGNTNFKGSHVVNFSQIKLEKNLIITYPDALGGSLVIRDVLGVENRYPMSCPNKKGVVGCHQPSTFVEKLNMLYVLQQEPGLTKLLCCTCHAGW